MTENETIERCDLLINSLSVNNGVTNAFCDRSKGYVTFEKMREFTKSCKKALEEVQQYRLIGTVEECRAAVEKQKVNKIVHVKLRQSEWGSEYRCPVCESDLIKTVFFNEDGTEPDEKISWCSGCGQKLDWSDEE